MRTLWIAMGLFIIGLGVSSKPAFALGGKIKWEEIKAIITTGAPTSAFAKWVCSCHFGSGLPVKSCLKNSSLPSIVSALVKIEINEDEKSVLVRPARLALRLTKRSSLPSHHVVFRADQPQLGCTASQVFKADGDFE